MWRKIFVPDKSSPVLDSNIILEQRFALRNHFFLIVFG